jgi:hypothetical protein
MRRRVPSRLLTTRRDEAVSTGPGPVTRTGEVARPQDLDLVRVPGPSIGAGRGRQATLEEMLPEAAYVVGAGIGIETIQFTVCDVRGAARSSREAPSEVFAGCSQTEIVHLLADFVREAMHVSALDWDRLSV